MISVVKKMLWIGCAAMLMGCQTAVIRDNPSVGGKLYAFKSDSQGFDTKNYFYDSGKEVVVFDAQFTGAHAQKSLEYIRSKTSSPIKYLVITHPNPDKYNGLEVFRKAGAKVIASRQTVAAMPGVHAYKKYYFVKVAKSFSDATYPKLGKVDLQFDGSYELKLSSGEVLKLTELGGVGVSSNQTVAYIPSQKAYVVGDLIHHKVHAWLEGGIVKGKPAPDLSAWRKTLEKLGQLAKGDGAAKVYGGRGESAPLREAIAAQQQYLQRAEQLVVEYIQQLGSRRSELQGDKASQHYAALQKKFEAAFPKYGLGYMIGYGVYGLVNAKLAK